MSFSNIVVCLLAATTFVYAACPDSGGGWTKFSELSFGDEEKIVIAAGEKYLFDLDSESPLYESIRVSGQLVFADGADRTLNVESVTVLDGGEFLIGSCDCPFESVARINLNTPSNINANPDGVGTKVIGVVDGGVLEFHGMLYGPSWTVLDVSMNIGDTSFTVAEDVEWRVGDQVYLPSTDYDMDHFDYFNITAVDGRLISVDRPADFPHHSGIYHGVDERGEVAVLNRNIKVYGEREDVTRFGGHMMFKGDFTRVLLQGVEVSLCGQGGVLARYPVHFHLAGDVSERAYVKDCSVHDNYQRSYVVHGTNGLILRRNVAVKTFGHMYFIEDGDEVNNEFSWNFASRPFRVDDSSFRIIPSDTEAVGFWITNPQNSFQNNVVAGSSSHCFWYALPKEPMGNAYSVNPTIFPRRTPLQLFKYNRAHSCGADGLHIDRGPNKDGFPEGTVYTPVKQPNAALMTSEEDDVAVEAVVEAFTAYKSRNRGTWIRGGLITMRHAAFADNAIGVTFATNAYMGNCTDSVFIGETANVGVADSWETTCEDGRPLPKPWHDSDGENFDIRGYEFYDGPNVVQNSHFWGFKPNSCREAGAVAMLRKDEFSIAPTNAASGIYYGDDSRQVWFPFQTHDGDKASVFYDLDGSITGHPPNAAKNSSAVITNNLEFLKTKNCYEESDWEVYVCPNHFGRLSAYIDSTVTYPATLDYLATLYRTENHNNPVYMCGGACPQAADTSNSNPTPSGGGTPNDFRMTVVVGREHTLHWETSPPTKMRLQLSYTDMFKYGNAENGYNDLVVGVCYPKDAVVKSVRWNWKDDVSEASSKSEMETLEVPLKEWATRGDGMWYHDKESGYIWMRVVPYEARTEENWRDAWPASDVELNVQLNSGTSSKAVCDVPRSTEGPDDDLPSSGRASPPETLAPFPLSAQRDEDDECLFTPLAEVDPIDSVPYRVTTFENDASATRATVGVTLLAVALTFVSLL